MKAGKRKEKKTVEIPARNQKDLVTNSVQNEGTETVRKTVSKEMSPTMKRDRKTRKMSEGNE